MSNISFIFKCIFRIKSIYRQSRYSRNIDFDTSYRVAFVREEGWWSAIDLAVETWSSIPPEEQEEIVEGIEKGVVEFIQLLDTAVGPRKVEIVVLPKVRICGEIGIYCAEIRETTDKFGAPVRGLKTY